MRSTTVIRTLLVSASKRIGAMLFLLLVSLTFAFSQAPTITSFTPDSGPVGSLVKISGTNLSGVSSCTVAGTAAIVVSKSAGLLVAMVMPGTGTGNVGVVAPGGNATSSDVFTTTATRPLAQQEGSKLSGSGGVASPQQGYATAISADGNTALIAGPYDNNGKGVVWAFTRTGTSWSQQGLKFAGNDSIGNPNQGYSVALSADGNTAIIGGPSDNNGIGAAWVFVRSGTTWSQQGSKLVGTGSTGGSGGLVYQGASVAVSADGNTALVGGFYDDNLKGAVWAFKRTGTSWSQVGSKLTPSDNTGFAAFGCSIAISADGKNFISGGYYDNNNVGAAWVFTFNGTTWSQQGSKLVGTGTLGSAILQGYSVAIGADGNTAIVGGPSDNNGIGAAWVFTRSGSTWSQQAKIIGSGYSGSPAQGTSVALSADGNIALTGGQQDNSNRGALWVFSRSGSTWTQAGSKLVATGFSGSPQIGYSTSYSADGTTAITGGYADNSFKGAAWIFVPASSNANLSNLTISSGTLSPVFASSTLSYAVSVAGTTSSVTVTPTPEEPNADIQVRINAGSYSSVAASTASSPLNLNVGVNTIEVLVTAADGVTTSTYTISVTRPCTGLSATISGSASICAGSSTNLVVNITGGVAPYTVVYSGGTVTNYNSGSNISVSPSSGTNYTLTSVTDVNNCTSTVSGTAVVTIKAVAAIGSVSAAENPVCPSGTTTLTANGVAGANAVVNFWTGSGGTGMLLGTGTTLNNAGAGTYYARVTADCGTPVEASIIITNRSVAAPGAQSTSACSGSSFSLTPSGTPTGTTYSWSLPTYSGSVSGGTAQTGQASISDLLTNSGASAGSATYTVTPQTGTCTGSPFTVTVTVHPRPVPSLNATPGPGVCAGIDVAYTTQSGMSNYTWSVPGTLGTDYTITTGSTSTSSNAVTIKWLGQGNKTVTVNYMDGNGCTGTAAASASINVTSSSSPSVSTNITAGTNPSCSGGSVTFTAVPVNGGANPTYQWYSNNAPVNGATSATYTVNNITATNTPSVYVMMTVTPGGCATSGTASSTPVAITISNIWTGSFSSQWGDFRNWCSGAVPTATSDVMIPTTSRNPLITSASFVKNIEIQAGASVTISNTTLNVAGSVAGSGVFTGAGNSVINFSGTGNIGTLNFGTDGIGSINFTGSGATATLGTNVNVFTSVNVGSSTLISNGRLTLKSNSAGTASVGPISGAGGITGWVTVERFIPKNAFRAWRLLSVPVFGTQTFNQAWQEGQSAMAIGTAGYGTLLTSAAGGNGYDAQTAGNSLLRFNQGNPGFWSPVSSTHNVMNTNSGYMVYIRGDRTASIQAGSQNPTATTLRTTGTLYQGTQPVITVPANVNVVVGNVYASAVDFALLTRPGISAFKVWDPKLEGSSGLGGYQTFSAILSYDPVPGGGSYGNISNSRIESGQAFVVSSTGGGSIQFTETAKASGSRNVFRTNHTVPTFRTNLYVEKASGPQLADGNVVVFDAAFSNDADDNDVEKAMNMGENLSISKAAKSWVIDARKPVMSSDTIFFHIANLKQQSYTLAFVPKNMDASMSAFLEDRYTGSQTSIDLTREVTYHFSVTTDQQSFAQDRFRIVFRSVVPISVFNLSGTAVAGNVRVTWMIGNEQPGAVYTVEHSFDGNIFSPIGSVQGSMATAYSFLHENPSAGDHFYRIRVTSATGVLYSKTTRYQLPDVIPVVEVYPNPITDHRLTIRTTNLPAGRYFIRLLSKSGSVEFSRSLEVNTFTGMFSFSLPNELPAGSYTLETRGKAALRLTNQVIVSRYK